MFTADDINESATLQPQLSRFWREKGMKGDRRGCSRASDF